MILTELDAVNLILRKMGEPPIISLDTQYPTLDLVFPALEQARTELLIEGWWFNSFPKTVLLPTLDGRVAVPPDTLMFYPDDTEKFLYAGTEIVAPDGNPILGVSVPGRRITDVALEKLPHSARACVTYSACVQVYAADVGVDDIYENIIQAYQLAYRELSRAHTRQRKYSMRTKLQYARWQSMLRS